LDMLSSPEWYEKKLHLSLGLKSISENIFNGYKIGNELILINGIFTFAGLLLISKKTINTALENEISSTEKIVN
jgi:hypothetical protein